MKSLLVLGDECPKGRELIEHIQQAAQDLELDYEISRINDHETIRGFGVHTIPALVVDDAVKVAGRVHTIEELKIILA